MFKIDNLNSNELKIASVKCRNDLLFFTRFFFRLLKGTKFILNDHHVTICNELQATADYKYQFLNINIPPRHSKTELAGINFIAWSLAKNPKANFLYITASDELRSDTSIRIRDIVTHPLYKSMFGVELKKDQQGKNLWRTSEGGGLKTATIFGQITGFGAGRMYDTSLIDYVRDFDGAIILDDINKILDTENNSANNNKTLEILFNTILSRKNSEDTPIINIQQRTGKRDATAVLLEYFKDLNHKSLVMPIITSDGSPLWANKFSLEQIDKLRTSPETRRIFQTQYMQIPQSREKLLFDIDQLNFFKDFHKENAFAKVCYVDTADVGKDYLFSGFAYLIKSDTGIQIFIDKIIYNPKKLGINQPKIIDYVNLNRFDYLIMESNQLSSVEIVNIQKSLEGVRFIPKRNTKNKEERIAKEADWIVQTCHFRNEPKSTEYGLAIAHLLDYEEFVKNQKDDCPDGLTGLIDFCKIKFQNLFIN